MSDSSGNWFGKLFKKVSQQDPGVAPKPIPELDPRDVAAWNNKGVSLDNLSRNEEAIRCHDKALELDPRQAAAWINKALAEDKVSHWREAALSYQQFLALAPVQQYTKQIEYAHKRLRELGG